MLPQSKHRKSRNSSKVNLIISATFHGVIMLALTYFAARQGLLGKTIKKIAVEMVKEKKPEKPKEPEKAKPEVAKAEEPKVTPKIAPPPEVARTPPPPSSGAAAPPPSVAPAAVDVPSFAFEGGKTVETSSDPIKLYKSLLEYQLRARWDFPEDLAANSLVTEVEVAVDPKGQISNPVWKKPSNNKRWDDSVRQALATTKGVNRPPPANFPNRVIVRFDAVAALTEPVLQ